MGKWEEWLPLTRNAVNDEIISKFLKIGHVFKIPKGETIYGEGLDNRLFILLSGRIEISITSASGRKRVIAVHEGSTFIDDAFVDSICFAITLTSLSPCEFIVVENEAIIKCGYEDPIIFLSLLQSAVLKIQGLAENLAAQTFDEVENRIFLFLSKYAKHFGYKTNEGFCIDNAPTHQFIADMVGSTRVRVTQVLNNLSKQGFIKQYGKKFILYAKDDGLRKITRAVN